jgi:hypothetical protein
VEKICEKDEIKECCCNNVMEKILYFVTEGWRLKLRLLDTYGSTYNNNKKKRDIKKCETVVGIISVI